MRPIETFPLAWEHVLWSASPAFPVSLARPSTGYALTDFRLVVRCGDRTVQEVALDEVEDVRLTQSWWQHPSGTCTVHVRSRRDGSLLHLSNIRGGAHLALMLELRVSDLLGDEHLSRIDTELFRIGVGGDAPPGPRKHRGLLLAATAAFGVLFVAGGIARHDSLPPVEYSSDDPIAPNGRRRSTEEIVAFMEREVMPFARHTLAPLVGGADAVTCETCHGADAARRQWMMPGVRALPEPEFRFAGLERAGRSLDPQMRNAVYGYLAEEDNQTLAAYMRREVMPGMAAIMRRPAYDFAKSYGYNRSRRAVGCYHCHLVE